MVVRYEMRDYKHKSKFQKGKNNGYFQCGIDNRNQNQNVHPD